SQSSYLFMKARDHTRQTRKGTATDKLHRRRDGSASRGGAARGETVITAGQEEEFCQACAEENEEYEGCEGDGHIGGAYLAFGKRAEKGKMVIGRTALMKCLMQGMRDREGGRDKEQHSQQTG